MEFQVYKIHSDFYYVKDLCDKQEYTCKLKETIKKQKIDVFVGDFVELSEEKDKIVSVVKRKNQIPRPKASNIDLALVVASLKEPDLDLIQLNRYLIFLKYHNVDTAICFNKEDLDDNLENNIKNIKDIYEKLGYKIFFISAKNKIGLEELKEYIINKTTTLVGSSGVGKSTLLNSLNFKNETTLRTQDVSSKTQRGRHTTRHCEIIEFDEFKIMDTPGFSCLKFDFLLPTELLNLFDDIKIYAKNCKYSNCYHDVKQENICNVYDNLDKIAPSRYESYLLFLKESLEYKEHISKRSIKEEKFNKNVGNKTLTKVSKRKRQNSRNTFNQNIKDME